MGGNISFQSGDIAAISPLSNSSSAAATGFSTSYAYRPTEAASFGILGTATLTATANGQYLQPYLLAPTVAGANQSIVTCATISPLSGLTVTASILCPIPVTNIAPGVATISWRALVSGSSFADYATSFAFLVASTSTQVVSATTTSTTIATAVSSPVVTTDASTVATSTQTIATILTGLSTAYTTCSSSGTSISRSSSISYDSDCPSPSPLTTRTLNPWVACGNAGSCGTCGCADPSKTYAKIQEKIPRLGPTTLLWPTTVLDVFGGVTNTYTSSGLPFVTVVGGQTVGQVFGPTSLLNPTTLLKRQASSSYVAPQFTLSNGGTSAGPVVASTSTSIMVVISSTTSTEQTVTTTVSEVVVTAMSTVDQRSKTTNSVDCIDETTSSAVNGGQTVTPVA